MSAKIRLSEMPSGDYCFELIADNRAIIGTSDQFAAKDQAQLAIQALISNSVTCKLLTDLNDKHYFELYAGDGTRVLRSLSFASEQAVLDAVALARQTAKVAKITERHRKS